MKLYTPPRIVVQGTVAELTLGSICGVTKVGSGTDSLTGLTGSVVQGGGTVTEIYEENPDGTCPAPGA